MSRAIERDFGFHNTLKAVISKIILRLKKYVLKMYAYFVIIIGNMMIEVYVWQRAIISYISS